jgi:disulfide bond formation protein DsbB
MSFARDTRLAAAALFAASAALLAGALAFQYWGGLQPCVLCLWQRYAHVGVMGFAMLAFVLGRTPTGGLLLIASGLAALAGAGIAGFHVGVEQHWWQGTSECGSTLGPAATIDELRARLLAQPVVRCDEVAWSLFGISMAGYNFILSLALAAFAFAAAARAGFGAGLQAGRA